MNFFESRRCTILVGTAAAIILFYCLFPRLKTLVCHERPKPSVVCKAFTAEECKGYLGRDVVSAGYKPIQITVTNSTDEYFQLNVKDISLKTVAADVVAQSVYNNTTGCMTAWGIASCFIPILIVPGIVLSARSYEKNQKLTNDFICGSLNDTTIAPGASINGTIFVAIQDYNDTFTISLINRDSQMKINYTVSLCNGRFISH